MPLIDAFVLPTLPSPLPFSTPTSTPQLIPLLRKPLNSPCLSRRRLRTTTAQTPPPETPQPESSDPQPEPTPQSEPLKTPDPDRDASDLVMPNLKELFAGAGRPGCEQCNGGGEIECPVCDAKGFITMTMMDTTSSTQCRMCRGSRIIPCPSCRDIVYKSVLWWDQIPSAEEDPDENWRQGPDGEPRIPWTPPPPGS